MPESPQKLMPWDHLAELENLLSDAPEIVRGVTLGHIEALKTEYGNHSTKLEESDAEMRRQCMLKVKLLERTEKLEDDLKLLQKQCDFESEHREKYRQRNIADSERIKELEKELRRLRMEIQCLHSRKELFRIASEKAEEENSRLREQLDPTGE